MIRPYSGYVHISVVCRSLFNLFVGVIQANDPKDVLAVLKVEKIDKVITFLFFLFVAPFFCLCVCGLFQISKYLYCM